MKGRVRKGKLRFVRSETTSLYRLAIAQERGAWVNYPVKFTYKPDVVLRSNMPVIGLGEHTDDGYTRVLTSAGPVWIRAMDLTDGPEPEP